MMFWIGFGVGIAVGIIAAASVVIGWTVCAINRVDADERNNDEY